jgi:hypothetical protein
MKKLIPIHAFVFFTLLSLNIQAQTKESAIISMVASGDFLKYKMSVYINNEASRNDKEFIREDAFVELNKALNKLLAEGWKIVSSSQSITTAVNLIVILERDKK